MTIHPECCGHGRTWDQPCDACEDVWREDRIKELHKQAARYGFHLTPISEQRIMHRALRRSLRPLSITCPHCGLTSYHPKDIEEGYCVRCHEWHQGFPDYGSQSREA